MIAVVSQAWTADADDAADGYQAGIEEFGEFHRGQPGFRGRVGARSRTDDTHFTNIRFFDTVEDYEAMIHGPGYAEHIEGARRPPAATRGCPGQGLRGGRAARLAPMGEPGTPGG